MRCAYCRVHYEHPKHYFLLPIVILFNVGVRKEQQLLEPLTMFWLTLERAWEDF